MQVKMIMNKKADTIITALTDSWCMNVGFPSERFFADNGGEFANIKLDELTSKLRFLVKFSPSYSPWSNGLKEHNHASADITIKKVMEENRVALSDSLIKAAAWTHNTSVNRLGYSPLQLVTGQAVMVPGLTTGNIATESMTDSEAVRRTIENLMKIMSEFRVGHEEETKGMSKCLSPRISTSWRLHRRRQGLVPALKWERMARPSLV